MRTVRKILLPTDFSSCAEAATQMAIQMAKAFGAELVLLYIYHAPLYPGALGEPYVVPDSLVERLRSDADRALTGLQDRIRAAGVSCKTLALEGLARDVIVEVARDTGADLIVMGTHGRTGFKHLLLGSVSERVVRTATCPVLTVREPT